MYKYMDVEKRDFTHLMSTTSAQFARFESVLDLVEVVVVDDDNWLFFWTAKRGDILVVMKVVSLNFGGMVCDVEWRELTTAKASTPT